MDPLNLPLRDIHLPDAVSWWPLAPGWWLVTAALLLGALTVYLVRRHRRLAWTRAVRRELRHLGRQFAANNDATELLRGTATLMRRALIDREGRSAVAAATGAEWLAILDGADPARPFTNGAGKCLVDAPYRQSVTTSSIDAAALLKICERRLLQVAVR